MKCLLPSCDTEGSPHFSGCCSFAHRNQAFIAARHYGLDILREAAAQRSEGYTKTALIQETVGLIPRLNFDGATFDREKDSGRLSGQLANVYRLMRDGRWRTLNEIAESIGACSEAGVSARLRDLRKPQFGKCLVDRQRRNERGLWEYRLCL